MKTSSLAKRKEKRRVLDNGIVIVVFAVVDRLDKLHREDGNIVIIIEAVLWFL